MDYYNKILDSFLEPYQDQEHSEMYAKAYDDMNSCKSIWTMIDQGDINEILSTMILVKIREWNYEILKQEGIHEKLCQAWRDASSIANFYTHF